RTPPLPRSGRCSDTCPVPNQREETNTAAKKTMTETMTAATYPAEPPPNIAATPVNEAIAPNPVTTATTANRIEENDRITCRHGPGEYENCGASAGICWSASASEL